MLRIKNKKALAIVLGVAVIFYQLHGMNYFKGFKPEWLTTENLRQKSYNVIRSPLFWMVLGSGVIAFAIWNRPKNRPAPGSGAPPSSGSSSTSVQVSGIPLRQTSGNAPSAVEQSRQEEEERLKIKEEKKLKALEVQREREKHESKEMQEDAARQAHFRFVQYEQRILNEIGTEIRPDISVEAKIREVLNGIGESVRGSLYNFINQFMQDHPMV